MSTTSESSVDPPKHQEQVTLFNICNCCIAGNIGGNDYLVKLLEK